MKSSSPFYLIDFSTEIVLQVKELYVRTLSLKRFYTVDCETADTGY